jgi:hypothetical protein
MDNWPTASAIDARIDMSNRANNRVSKLTGTGATFLELGKSFGINPGIITAILQRESQLGADGSHLPVDLNNFGGITQSGDAGTEFFIDRNWAVFSSPMAGLRAEFALLDTPLYRNTGGKMEDILDLYSPESDGNPRGPIWETFHAVAKQLDIAIEPDINIYGGTRVAAGVAEPWSATITSNGAALRELPDKESVQIASLSEGDRPALTGDDEHGFLEVQMNGHKGWVHHTHLVATAFRAVDLRRTPRLVDDDSNVAERLPPGTVVDLDGHSTIGFLEIAFNGSTAWAFRQYLRVNGVPIREVTAGQVVTAGGLSGDKLNIRDAPILDGSAVVGQLAAGQEATLTGNFRPGFASIRWHDSRRWVLAESITGGSGLKISQRQRLTEDMRQAGMCISQGPFEPFSHKICDCFDMAVISGTPVHSIAEGTVIASRAPQPNDDDAVYAPNYVDVQTRYGPIRYAHLTQRNVNVGDVVSLDTLLGLSGKAGTGAHLHLQLDGGKASSPLGMTLTEILADVGFDLTSFKRCD